MSDEDLRTYVVVRNEEEQYSLWLADRPLLEGWSDCGVRGNKQVCLDHIEREWKDLRPLSVRR